MKVTKPPERMLFGQFLLESKKLTGNELAMALYQQSKQRHDYRTTQYLGQILLDQGIFENNDELNDYLEKFRDYNLEMLEVYNDAREVVRENRKQLIESGELSLEEETEDPAQPGIDLGDIEIAELQGYISTIDQFLDASQAVIEDIRTRQVDRDGLIEIARRMGEIRQAILSLAPKK